MKIAVYCRVSTDTENQLHSLENQQKHYIQYAQEKGYEIVKIYADEGLSGTNVKRKEFLAMIYDAGLDIKKDEDGKYIFSISERKPKFEYIITKDVSRFARNVNAIEIAQMLREKGVYILFENVGIDTKDVNYRFMLNMFLNFAEHESVDRSKKVQFGLKRRAKEGKYHFSERMFGYIYDTENKCVRIVEEEAAIVREIFDMYTKQKIGSRKIADILNERGLKTTHDKIFTAPRITTILKNEHYTGTVTLNKWTMGEVTSSNRKRKTKDESEWVRVANAIPAIISKETFEHAQQIMNERSQKIGVHKRGLKMPIDEFSKKIVCGKCGSNYIRNAQTQNGNKYYFYNCANRRRTKQCDNKSVSLLRLEKGIQYYMYKGLHKVLNRMKDGMIHGLKEKILKLEQKKDRAKHERKSIEQQIIEKKKEIDLLIESFLKQKGSETVAKIIEKKIEHLENERQALERQKLEYDDIEIDKEIERAKMEIEIIEDMSKRKTFTRQEVLERIACITVDEEGEIGFIFGLTDSFKPNVEEVREFFTENML
ncbi:recombinase family protein [Anoxybacillus salavatliensis]|uniref:recombinase family protein n=1 Tax=Anoxybacillus gonensis TaxID=198467 RepID=UPI00214B527D|nr:recombinase family protein [Anoxybacillus gonensis]MCQ5364146.1 recombinase family protein [Anoxybacillus gonensis]